MWGIKCAWSKLQEIYWLFIGSILCDIYNKFLDVLDVIVSFYVDLQFFMQNEI